LSSAYLKKDSHCW